MPNRWPTLDTTSADLEVVLSDNGNDATTITFYYGTTDGGTTPGSWDSNLSFSNASEATIRVSATGLTSGQTYYFRALAKNSSSQNNGEDWANSSTAFTTVTSSDPGRDRSGALLRPGRLVETGRQPQ